MLVGFPYPCTADSVSKLAPLNPPSTVPRVSRDMDGPCATDDDPGSTAEIPMPRKIPMVCDLPDAVCPYAMMRPFSPTRHPSTTGAARLSISEENAEKNSEKNTEDAVGGKHYKHMAMAS